MTRIQSCLVVLLFAGVAVATPVPQQTSFHDGFVRALNFPDEVSLDGLPARSEIDDLLGGGEASIRARKALSLGLPPLPDVSPPFPAFGTFEDSLRALAESAAAPISDNATRAAARLDRERPVLAAALTKVVGAQVGLARATHAALGGDDAVAQLLAARNVAAMLALAQGGLEQAAVDPIIECGLFAFELAGTDSIYPGGCDFHVQVDVGGDDLYLNHAGSAALDPYELKPVAFSAAIAIDLAGNDVYNYSGNEGGSFGAAVAGRATALLLDWEGNDRYEGTQGAALAYNEGVATLLDLGGDDVYENDYGNAASLGGIAALLFDGGGSDVYRADWVGNAFAAQHGGTTLFDMFGTDSTVGGTAILVDIMGADSYTVGEGGGNGAAVAEEGLGPVVPATYLAPARLAAALIDGDGEDLFTAELAGVAAANGAAIRGSALLFDGGGGSDEFSARLGSWQSASGQIAANGAATWMGRAVLISEAGDEQYSVVATTREAAANAGGLAGGQGYLLDEGGNDVYTANLLEGAANGGAIVGLGVLLDLTGHDRYESMIAGSGGANGGAIGTGGTGILVDLAGDNSFTAHGPRYGGSNGAAGGPTLDAGVSMGGLGILISGPGDDTFVGDNLTQGAGDLYGIGILADAGGNNSYTAGPGGLAQGAARNLGTGVLVDAGLRSTFRLLDGTTGQGSGLQGVGVLLRTNPQGVSLYDVALGTGSSSGGFSSTIAGAGAGFRIDEGLFQLVGKLPTFECDVGRQLAAIEIDTPVPHLYEARLCAHDAATEQPIVDPASGEPIAPLPRPFIGCSGMQFPVSCAYLVSFALGPRAAAWLESDEFTMRSSGGLALLQGRDLATALLGDPSSALAVYRQKTVLHSADDTCDIYCYRLGGA